MPESGEVVPALLNEKAIGFKLDVPHAPDCFIEGTARAFVLCDGGEFDRDKLGRRNGHTLWHRFRCNDPSCPAIMLVRWDVLSDFIDAGSGGGSGG